MKIAVLGGAGDMGSQVVQDLSASTEVEEVLIADYNLLKAKELASSLGQKARALFVNADDPSSVSEVVRKCQVAVSCIGPFYRFEAKVARAVLESGIPYVSLCDDFDATEQVLPLDGLAREKGVVALSGCGWTPGLSNILARMGIEALNGAKRVRIAWSGDAADSEGLAVIQHTLHIFTGQVKTFKNGTFQWVPAGSGREEISFPSPIGRVPVFHVGHPEPVTLPRVFPQLESVSLQGGLTPPWLNGLAKTMATLKLTNTAAKKRVVAKITQSLSLLMKIGGVGRAGLFVEVASPKERVVFRAADHMRRLTGLPASIVAQMVARGEVEGVGVQFPEACVPAAPFIQELAKRGVHIFRSKGKAVA